MAPSAIDTTEHHEHFIDTDEHQSLTNISNGTTKADILVRQALEDRVKNIDTDFCEAGEEDAFFVADMGEVYRQYLRWKKQLPRVKPHYAVKCNPDPNVLKLLAALGTGFDCASKAEIDQVLALGVDPTRIIYAQPCKTKSYIRHAAATRVRQMTFDNADELYKIRALYPDAELYLRILTDDSASLCQLSLKFGAALSDTKDLLQLAKALELNVVGVSFHVGSGASDPSAFKRAVEDARTVFDQAEEVGYSLHTLDVGGGFASDLFEDMAAVLRQALDTHFSPSVRIIGEPGRYFVARAYTLACSVIARRAVSGPKGGAGTPRYMLYLNDGVYGNFSSIIFDHQQPIAHVLRAASGMGPAKPITTSANGQPLNGVKASNGFEYSLWGPTCDGIDRIAAHQVLPVVLDVGDWLFFPDMGAYTRCSATKFNGFENHHAVVYVYSEPGAQSLMG